VNILSLLPELQNVIRIQNLNGWNHEISPMGTGLWRETEEQA